MSSILNALAQGYTASSVLKMLTASNPNLKSKVGKALAAGYTIDKILSFLSKSTAQNQEGVDLSSSERIARNSERAGNVAKTGVAALGALGLAGLYRAGQPNVMSNAPLQPQTNATNAGMRQQQGLQNQQPQPQQALGNQPASAQPQVHLQPGTPTQPQTQLQTPQVAIPTQQSSINSSSILKQMNVEEKINNLLKAGNAPEIVGHLVDQQLKPGEKKWLDSQIKEGKAKPMVEMVKEYATGSPQENEGLKNLSAVDIQRKYKIGYAEAHKMREEAAKPLKGEMVATPHGIVGDLEDVRATKALVKDDAGKLHQVSSDDLIQSPLSKKDLAELHDDLIRGIEHETGEQVSRNVNWAGYDPENNELLYLPHDGSAYVYPNLDPEDIQQLTNILNTRKTTGSNFIGAWAQGSKSPIGAAMSVLIRKLQAEAGGKGKEYIRKYGTVYSALEPSIKAAKEAERKRRKKK